MLELKMSLRDAKSKIQFSPLTYRAIYPSRFLWCELLSYGDIGFLLNIIGLYGTWLEMLKAPKMHLKKKKSKDYDSVTQDDPQTLLRAR